MAVAVALLMIGGEFDLSAGAMTGFTGLDDRHPDDASTASTSGWRSSSRSRWRSAIGALNGFLVMRTGLPSFIVTLGTFFVLQGIDLAGHQGADRPGRDPGHVRTPRLRPGQELFGSSVDDLGGAVRRPRLRRRCSGGSASPPSRPGCCCAPGPATGSSPSAARRPAARQVGVPVFRTKVGLFMTTAGAGWLVGMLLAVQDLDRAEQHRRGPGVHLHHLRRRRWLPADRRLRLGDRRGARRPDLRHGQPGHRLRRAGTTTGSTRSSA